ncbi:uncharacterized protein LOC125179537 [Hyalella azteca]|uniref:Uncharacterized protein LOC125179537 n=1 Tax=Hyalella azteca TaxID=294128 RepID=A0A979FYH7_HYAAZ|nr:uncharacterized protein LOC125179537 [Hyalella azteca]
MGLCLPRFCWDKIHVLPSSSPHVLPSPSSHVLPSSSLPRAAFPFTPTCCLPLSPHVLPSSSPHVLPSLSPHPLSRNLIKDDRLRRSPDNFTVNFSDVGRFKSSPPQELATKVELDPRLDFRPLIVDDDDLDDSSERKAIFIRRIDDFKDRTHQPPPDTVYGLRIPKENSSVHHAASTRVKIPMKIPAPERSVNSQLFTIETNEVDDLGHVLHQSDEEDMSNELISFFQNLRPTTAKPPVKIVVSSETNATHMSINIPRKIVQRHPAIVSNFVRSFINQKPQPVDEYDFYSRNYNIGANKAELPYERSGTSHGQDRRPFKTNSFQNYFKSRTEKLSSVLGHSTLKSHFGVYDDVPSVVPIMNAAKEMDKDSNINQAKNNKERYRPAKYEFSYEISEDDVQMGHQEARSGHRVDGEYHVLLPNGLRQIVTYYADETGYHPTIRYDPPIKLSPRKVLSIPQTDDLSRGALAITASSSASPTATNMAAEAVPLASQNFNTGNSLHSISFPDEEATRLDECI